MPSSQLVVVVVVAECLVGVVVVEVRAGNVAPCRDLRGVVLVEADRVSF